MAPQLFLADVFPPLGGDTFAPPTSPPADAPGGTFDDYLADARSAQRIDAPAPDDQARRSDDDEYDEDQATPAPPESEDGQDNQAALPPTDAALAPPVQNTLTIGDAPVEPSPQPGQNPGAPAARPTGQPLVGASPEAPAEAAGRPIESEPRGEAVRHSSSTLPVEGGADRKEPGPSTSASNPESTTVPEPPTPSEKISPSDSKPTPKPEESTTLRVEADSPQLPKRGESKATVSSAAPQEGQIGKEPAAGDNTSKVGAQSPVPSGPPRPRIGQETIHDLKVKDAIARRRQGSATGRGSPAGTRGPQAGGVASDPLDGSGGRPASETIDAAKRIELLSVRSASGDSAAASVARFVLADADASPVPGRTADGALHGMSHGPAGAVATFSSPTGLTTTGDAPAPGDPLGLASLDGPDAMSGAARVLKAAGGGGRFQITLQLHPPELGQMRLQIRMQQQAMTLHVDVQTREVARLVESRLSELRDALAGHGIRVDRTEVVVRSPASAEAQLHQQHAQGGGDGADQGPDSPTSDDERTEAGRDQRSDGHQGGDLPGDQHSDDLGVGEATAGHAIQGSETDDKSKTTESLLNVMA